MSFRRWKEDDREEEYQTLQLCPIGHYKNQCKEPAKDEKDKVCTGTNYLKTKAEEKEKTVLGDTLSILGVSFRVLFNTGASHSFISRCLVDKISLETS